MANPIRTVLAAIREARVRALLMGGQACILYGAAEFSRGTDIAVVADADNLARLVDVHVARFADVRTDERVRFWLRELRTPALLTDVVRLAPALASEIAAERPAVAAALAPGDSDARLAAIRAALAAEEARERAADEAYWRPLLAEQAEMWAALRRGELALGWP